MGREIEEQTTYEYISSLLKSADEYGDIFWSEDAIAKKNAEYNSYLKYYKNFCMAAETVYAEYVSKRSDMEEKYDKAISDKEKEICLQYKSDEIKSARDSVDLLYKTFDTVRLGKNCKAADLSEIRSTYDKIFGEKTSEDIPQSIREIYTSNSAVIKELLDGKLSADSAGITLHELGEKRQKIWDRYAEFNDTLTQARMKLEEQRRAEYPKLKAQYGRKYNQLFESVPEKVRQNMTAHRETLDFTDIDNFKTVYDEFDKEKMVFEDETEEIYREAARNYYRNSIEPFATVVDYYFDAQKKGLIVDDKTISEFIEFNLDEQQKRKLFIDYKGMAGSPLEVLQSVGAQNVFSNACDKYVRMSAQFAKIGEYKLYSFDKMDMSIRSKFDAVMTENPRELLAASEKIQFEDRRINVWELKNKIIEESDAVRTIAEFGKRPRVSEEIMDSTVMQYENSIKSLRKKNGTANKVGVDSLLEDLDKIKDKDINPKNLASGLIGVRDNIERFKKNNKPGFFNRSLHESIRRAENFAFETDINSIMDEFYKSREDFLQRNISDGNELGLAGLSQSEISKKVSDLNKTIAGIDRTQDKLLEEFMTDIRKEDLDGIDILSDALQEHAADKTRFYGIVNEMQKEYESLSDSDKEGKRGQDLKAGIEYNQQRIADINELIARRINTVQQQVAKFDPEFLEKNDQLNKQREKAIAEKSAINDRRHEIKTPLFEVRDRLEKKLDKILEELGGNLQEKFDKIKTELGGMTREKLDEIIKEEGIDTQEKLDKIKTELAGEPQEKRDKIMKELSGEPQEKDSALYANMYNSIKSARADLGKALSVDDLKKSLDRARSPINQYVKKRDSFFIFTEKGRTRIDCAKEAQGMLEAFDRIFDTYTEKEKTFEAKNQKVKADISKIVPAGQRDMEKDGKLRERRSEIERVSVADIMAAETSKSKTSPDRVRQTLALAKQVTGKEAKRKDDLGMGGK